jgi:DNA polymerase III epsilon subunit-like protein
MICVDIEASGLDPKQSSMVSIGAIDLANPTRQFYEECKVWDGAHVSDEALAVNGFTREEVSDPQKKTEGEAIRLFLAWAWEIEGNRTLAGQNVSFDRDYLDAAAHREGIESDIAHRTIDTHTLAWMHMVKRGLTPPLENHRSKLNLDAILTYCGIPEEPKPHNALTGAMCHAEVTSRLLYNKKLLPEFEQFEIPFA